MGREHIDALFSMTPYYWRTSEGDKHKLSSLGTLTTQIEFEINVYKK
jgi:23S rRNA (guanine745-N1)-methyltransferase